MLDLGRAGYLVTIFGGNELTTKSASMPVKLFFKMIENELEIRLVIYDLRLLCVPQKRQTHITTQTRSQSHGLAPHHKQLK